MSAITPRDHNATTTLRDYALQSVLSWDQLTSQWNASDRDTPLPEEFTLDPALKARIQSAQQAFDHLMALGPSDLPACLKADNEAADERYQAAVEAFNAEAGRYVELKDQLRKWWPGADLATFKRFLEERLNAAYNKLSIPGRDKVAETPEMWYVARVGEAVAELQSAKSELAQAQKLLDQDNAWLARLRSALPAAPQQVPQDTAELAP